MTDWQSCCLALRFSDPGAAKQAVLTLTTLTIADLGVGAVDTCRDKVEWSFRLDGPTTFEKNTRPDVKGLPFIDIKVCSLTGGPSASHEIRLKSRVLGLRSLKNSSIMSKHDTNPGAGKMGVVAVTNRETHALKSSSMHLLKKACWLVKGRTLILDDE